MLHLTSDTDSTGILPASLSISELIDRGALIKLSEKIYDTDPNIVALLNTNRIYYIVKLFGWRHPVHYYISPTFDSRAQTSWDIAHALMQCGARTPRPIYVHTNRINGFIKENLYITEAIYPHQSLRKLLKTENNIERIKHAVKDLSRSIAGMHNGGIFHRDLTTGNFLVDSDGKVFIVDLNRAQKLPKLSIHQRLTDLAKIYLVPNSKEIPESELLYRFFSTYQVESKIHTDWISGYKDYREGLVSRRNMKRKVKRLLTG